MSFRALYRKNLWLWRPNRSLNVAIFAAALLFSIADAIWHFPGAVWTLTAVVALLVGQTGGMSTMQVDFKDDAIQFLEYLPIRWSAVWLANVVDQLLAVLLLIPLLCWHRVLFWTPSPEVPLGFREFPDLLDARWMLPFVLTSILFFTYSLALFVHTLCGNNSKWALFASNIGSMLLIGVCLAIPPLMGVFPSLRDFCLPMLIASAVLLGCSFVQFVLPPRHWTAVRRFTVVGFPMLLMLSAAEVASLVALSNHWKHLDWSEHGLQYERAEVNPKSPHQALISIESPRSGSHSVVFDLNSGQARYVGRHVRFLTSFSDADPTLPVLFRTEAFQIGREVRYGPIMALPPAGLPFEVRSDRFIDDGANGVFEIRWMTSTHWPSRLIASVSRQQDKKHLDKVFLIDGAGHVMQRWNTAYCYQSHNDQVLLHEESDSDDLAARSHRYQLYDIASGQESEFEIPGEPLGFSADLRSAICEPKWDKAAHPSVVIYDLATRSSRTILPEGVLSSPTGISGSLPLERPLGTDLHDRAYATDLAFEQMVLVDSHPEENSIRRSLIWVDLVHGIYRTLATEVEVPEGRYFSFGHRGFQLWGFNANADQFIYQVKHTLIHLNLRDGTRLETPLPGEYFLPKFCASGVRIAGIVSQAQGPEAIVQEAGASTPICKINGVRDLQWIDDEHLLVIEDKRVYTMDYKGGNLHNIVAK